MCNSCLFFSLKTQNTRNNIKDLNFLEQYFVVFNVNDSYIDMQLFQCFFFNSLAV